MIQNLQEGLANASKKVQQLWPFITSTKTHKTTVTTKFTPQLVRIFPRLKTVCILAIFQIAVLR